MSLSGCGYRSGSQMKTTFKVAPPPASFTLKRDQPRYPKLNSSCIYHANQANLCNASTRPVEHPKSPTRQAATVCRDERVSWRKNPHNPLHRAARHGNGLWMLHLLWCAMHPINAQIWRGRSRNGDMAIVSSSLGKHSGRPRRLVTRLFEKFDGRLRARSLGVPICLVFSAMFVVGHGGQCRGRQ